MFIERQQHPTIEFDAAAGQQEPDIAHYFSNMVDPFKSELPLLAEGGDGERVLVVTSPLSELLDETIRLYRHEDYPSMVVVDEKHRALFEAVKASLQQVLEKVDQIQFAPMEEEDDDESS